MEAEALKLQKKQKQLAEAHETIAMYERELQEGMRMCDDVLAKPMQPPCKAEPLSPEPPRDTQVNVSSAEGGDSPWSQDAQPLFDDVRRQLFLSPNKETLPKHAAEKPDERVEASTKDTLPSGSQLTLPDSSQPTDKQVPENNTGKQVPESNQDAGQQVPESIPPTGRQVPESNPVTGKQVPESNPTTGKQVPESNPSTGKQQENQNKCHAPNCPAARCRCGQAG